MRRKQRTKKKPAWSPPRVGQRMMKTAVAVFLCLIFYYLRGYRGEDMPTEAAVTAIICMQPYVRDSREYALNRLMGTLIGAGWGLTLLLLLLLFPALGQNLYGLYALMALGVLVGTAAAVGVNVFRLPRGRNGKLIFFLRSADLLPDRFAQLSPAVLFRLNSLHQDGARICLISRHAPAFVTSQLTAATLNLPMIVMDGAALYDVNENRYLYAETIPTVDSSLLMERLEQSGLSYFLYTVHRNRTCIFHRGTLSGQEWDILNRLRRSPYRSYLDEEVYMQEEIVCVKLIGRTAKIEKLKNRLYTFLLCRKLRASIQPQTGAPGISGLYIYSQRATVHRAETRLMDLLREREPGLEPVELFLPAGYRTEHDAMTLLHRLYNQYAPVRLFPVPRKQ